MRRELLRPLSFFFLTHLDRYLDGSSQTFEPEKLDVVEIMSDIHQHAHVINAKYEDEGKELEA